MNKWIIISAISILLTALMILLWWYIPGFPLLIFLLFPPLFCWGTQRDEEVPPSQPKSIAIPLYCSNCGKRLIEPLEPYCPRCGAPISTNTRTPVHQGREE